MMTQRLTFTPPPVEPAQAPINISTKSNVLENCGHKLKSVLENPVVDIILATWKEA